MIRLSPDDYARIQARIKGAGQTPEPKQAMKATGQRSKYGNEVTTTHGIEFDSKAEAARYLALQAMERAGEISDLRLQVEFVLLPPQDVDGHKERGVKYVADFTYLDQSGRLVVEDVKSGPTKTREFVIKRKLMMHVHGIVVREVMR
ncbi:MAG TPA: DUF1064 domain-containing protein [Rhodocyclaceae bacterium]|nr:DUF1064 domain-containing protein [Rhodocyclaceae bacterium]